MYMQKKIKNNKNLINFLIVVSILIFVGFYLVKIIVYQDCQNIINNHIEELFNSTTPIITTEGEELIVYNNQFVSNKTIRKFFVCD